MAKPILYRFTGTKTLQWFATMEAYFSYTGLFGDEHRIRFAVNYLDDEVQDWTVQWFGGFTKINDWETFKDAVVYRFGTIEEHCELHGIEIVYAKKKRAKKKLYHIVERVLEEESIQTNQEIEEDLIKTGQEIEEANDVHVEEEHLLEAVVPIRIQEDDPKLVGDKETNPQQTDSLKSQVSIPKLEPSLKHCEQLHSCCPLVVSFDLENEKLQVSKVEDRETLVRNGTYLTEGRIAHQVFGEMTLRHESYRKKKGKNLQQHEKRILSLLPKSWKFKFKKKGSKQMDIWALAKVVVAACYVEPQRLMERSIFRDKMVLMRAVHEAKWRNEMEKSVFISDKMEQEDDSGIENGSVKEVKLDKIVKYKKENLKTQETFAEYIARTAFERPLLSGVAYAKKDVNSEREMFERQHNWIIKTMDRGEPSLVKDEYAPVIFSQDSVSYLESLDMMSGEEDRENILRARETGKAVFTSPFRLLETHHLGVILTFPVYKSSLPENPTVQERIVATTGYRGDAFYVESLIKNLLGQLAGNQAIVMHAYDITNASNPLVMYGNQDEEADKNEKLQVVLRVYKDIFQKPATPPSFRSNHYHNHNHRPYMKQKLRLFPKCWKFKFKKKVLKDEKCDWKQNKGDQRELILQMELMIVYGSLSRSPDDHSRVGFWPKTRALAGKEHGESQSSSETFVLQFKMVLLFFFGTLPRPPEIMLR